jgi:hypothetical protein
VSTLITYSLTVAFDPKHLPEDPKILQQIVLDLMAQLNRESTERNKIETLLRELLDARSPSEKSCSLRSQTVGVDLVRSELTFE